MKEEKRFDIGSIAMIVGVIFIIVSGIVFATTNWKNMSGAEKCFCIGLITLLFFGGSVSAMKIFKMPKLGKALYILGSIFVMIDILGAGYFGMFGAANKLSVGNACTYCAVGFGLGELFILLGVTFFKTYIYNMAVFMGMTVELFLILAATDSKDYVVITVTAMFTLAVSIAAYIIKKKTMVGKEYIQKALFDYSEVNQYICSIVVFGGSLLINHGYNTYVYIIGAMAMAAIVAGVYIIAINNSFVMKIFPVIYMVSFIPMHNYFVSIILKSKLSIMNTFFVAFVALVIWDFLRKKNNESVISGMGIALSILNCLDGDLYLPFGIAVVMYLAAYIYIENSNKSYSKLIILSVLTDTFVLIKMACENYCLALLGCMVVMVVMLEAIVRIYENDSIVFARIVATVVTVLSIISYDPCGISDLWFGIVVILMTGYVYYRNSVVKYHIANIFLVIFSVAIPAKLISCFKGSEDGIIIFLMIMSCAYMITASIRKNIIDRENNIVDWFAVLQPIIFLMILSNDSDWFAEIMILCAVYVSMYLKQVRDDDRPVIVMAMCGFVTIAFWTQRIIDIPSEYVLVVDFIPVITIGCVFTKISGAKNDNLQKIYLTASYVILIIGAMWNGGVVNAVAVGVYLLVLFGLGYMRHESYYVKMAAGLMIAEMIYVTRTFWLSLSWWMYLLVVGIALVAFAARMEYRKQH